MTSSPPATSSDPGGSDCPFGDDYRDLTGLIYIGLTCAELEAEIETVGDDWRLIWDEGLPTETLADIDFGSIQRPNGDRRNSGDLPHPPRQLHGHRLHP